MIALFAHGAAMRERLLGFVRVHRALANRFDLVANAELGDRLLRLEAADGGAGPPLAHAAEASEAGARPPSSTSAPPAEPPRLVAASVGAHIASRRVCAAIIFADPCVERAHRAGADALARLCELHDVPCATTERGAAAILRAVAQEKQRGGSPPPRRQRRRPARGWSASGHQGVYPSGARWVAKVRVGGRAHYLGTFDTKREAASAHEAFVAARAE